MFSNSLLIFILQFYVQEVLVLGAGPIGLLAMQISKSLGCTRTIIADVNPARLQLAEKMGADVCIGKFVN